MAEKKSVQSACVAVLLAVLSAGAATTNVYTWTGGAVGDSGNWFNPTNWSGPSGYGVPGDTHNPNTPSLDKAYFAAASNVAGTVNYSYTLGVSPHTNVFSFLELLKTNAAPLTLNVDGNMTIEHNNVADPDWWNSATAIGNGGALTFNVNSGTCAVKEANLNLSLVNFTVSNNAAFIAFANSPSSNRKMTLAITGSARALGWLGTLGPTYSEGSTKYNYLTFTGNLALDGGTLYPDWLECSSYATLTVTNGATVRTRFGASGIVMNGYINKFYTNSIEISSGSVTNVGVLRMGGLNTYGTGTPWPGLSVVRLSGGSWFQGGATCIGDARLGMMVAAGGTFETPSDLYVGGARVGTDTVPAAGLAYSGSLTVTGGTVTVSNPDALNPHIATTAGTGTGANLDFGQAVWDYTYRGQRLLFTALKSGGAGLESNRVYWAADINTASDIQKSSFSVETNMTLTSTGVTGTSYATGTGNNTYCTLPARLMIGNVMTFAGPAYLMNTGTLNLVSGSLTADELVATNGAASVISFSGGTLSVKAATINTGSALTVGNGSSAAALNLLGTNACSFANGLVINTNAVFAIGGTNALGAAAVIGDVTLRTSSVLDVDFNAATNDWLQVTGTVSLPAQATLSLRALNATARTPIPVLRASGGITGTTTGWPHATANGVTYKAVVSGDQLSLEKVPGGTMIGVR